MDDRNVSLVLLFSKVYNLYHQGFQAVLAWSHTLLLHLVFPFVPYT